MIVSRGRLRRLLTANFLHDSFVHLASSCYALATVAPAIEEVRLPPRQWPISPKGFPGRCLRLF